MTEKSFTKPRQTRKRSGKWAKCLLVACFVAIQPISGLADEAAPKSFNTLGKEGYELWECAGLALVGQFDREIFDTLFDAGLERLEPFLEGWNNGQLTEENTQDVPMGLLLWLSEGPSVDFSLGFLWANLSAQVQNQSWVEADDAAGADQLSLQSLKAQNLFLRKLCPTLLGQ